MDVGTIGNRPCEVRLNQVLIGLNDPHVIRRVMSRHQALKQGLKTLKHLAEVDKGFCLHMLVMYYHDHLEKFQNSKDMMPEIVYTLALCCFHVLYNETLHEVKDAA